MIVNRAFAAKFFPGENPIGQLVYERTDVSADRSPVEIVGVVTNAAYTTLRDTTRAVMYWPISQVTAPRATATYAVSRRRLELGVRLALGTSPAGVVRLVMGRTARLVGVGLAAGIAASLALGVFARSLIVGLSPRDPATMLGASAVLSLAGAAAAWVPARRAARIDPARVLRE